MGKRGKAPAFLGFSCPNQECEHYGQKGYGNIVSNGTYRTQSGRVRKLICRSCGKVFNERTGTVFFDLRTAEEKVLMGIKRLLHGMSVRGVADVLDCKPDTVLGWLRRAADHSEKINDMLMRDIEISKIELDELWTFVKKKQLRKWKRQRASFGSG